MSRPRPALAGVVGAAATVCFACWCAVTVRPRYSHDDAEPEILNQAWRLAQGESLYRSIDTPPFLHTAYPPLYFGLLACLLRSFGLSYLPAKLLSLVSALAIGAGLVRLCRLWGRPPPRGAWVLGLLFLVPAFLYNTARVHPQMLAVALSLWAFVFLLSERFAVAVILSPLVAVLGIYTKQSQLALPIASLVWLALRRPRWLAPYAGVLLLAGLAPLAWLERATDGLFWRNIVQWNRLAYDPLQIPGILIHHAGPLGVALALAAAACWRRVRDERWELVDAYFVAALATTVVACGRIGAHGQYVVELLVVALALLLRATEFPALPGRETLVAVQIGFLLLYAPFFVFIEEGRFALASARAAARIDPLLPTHPGPILSQQGSFALFDAGGIQVQLFQFSALSRAGLWDEQRLCRQVDDHVFAWVITLFPIEDGIESDDDLERFTPELVAALKRSYAREALIEPYFLYRPR